MAASGWSKDDLRRAVWEAARVPLSGFSAENLDRFRAITPERFADQPPHTQVPICARPEDLMIIVAGGPGKHSCIVPTFGATRSVTVVVQ